MPPNHQISIWTQRKKKNVFLLLLCLAGQSEPHFKKLWGPEKKLHSILKTIKKMYAFHCISCTVKLHTIKAWTEFRLKKVRSYVQPLKPHLNLLTKNGVLKVEPKNFFSVRFFFACGAIFFLNVHLYFMTVFQLPTYT